MNITINIDKYTVKEINNTYGFDNYEIVKSVVENIIERYLSVEYFDPELQLEQEIDKHDSLDFFILEEIKKVISQIIENNGHDNSLFNASNFENAMSDSSFTITEYEISRIYTLSEVYYKLTQEPNCYGDIVEMIASYDC